jgi:hypothetical protein
MIAFERVIARRFRGRLRERSDGCCASKYKQQGKQPPYRDVHRASPVMTIEQVQSNGEMS